MRHALHVLPTLHAAFVAAVFAAATPLCAQEPEDPALRVDRRFTYLTESLHGAMPGHFEMENVVTWGRGVRGDGGLDRFDFKHEIEYGLADGVICAVDLVEWHTDDERDGWHTQYDATGAELKFRFTDARTDAVGLGWKTELGVGPRELEWENTLAIDKVVGPWELVYNLTLEAEGESERSYRYEEGELRALQGLGASYQLDQDLFVGFEALQEFPREWSWGERQNFFVGPNAAIRLPECALTATTLFLADGEAGAPRFQLRLLFEFDF